MRFSNATKNLADFTASKNAKIWKLMIWSNVLQVLALQLIAAAKEIKDDFNKKKELQVIYIYGAARSLSRARVRDARTRARSLSRSLPFVLSLSLSLEAGREMIFCIRN